jgi:putative pyruvate formate lyase activating enzyme
VNRLEGQRGFCGETSALRLAFAGIHRGEEPPVTGAGGSGTIFVSGCNLGCVFCQNFQISQGKHTSKENCVSHGVGRAVDTENFAEICLALQERGAENINIVTGSHAAPALALGIEAARKKGLFIPVLWNSSGYERQETLEILKNVVDVYLPDLKTLDREIANRFFNAPDYGEHATASILKMIEYRELRFSQEKTLQEILVSGVMVRHLVIPGFLENTRQVLRWFAENCKGRALLSLMTQYVPSGRSKKRKSNSGCSAASGYTPVETDVKIPERCISENEYETVLSMLSEFSIDDGFCQELVTNSDWLPDFTLPNPFSSELSFSVWHY